MTPRSLASFDPEAPAPPAPEGVAPADPAPAAAPPKPRLEASSIRSLEERRNRRISERLARERSTAATDPSADPSR